jgi:hypothetical protein
MSELMIGTGERSTYSDRIGDALLSIELAAHGNLGDHHPDEQIILEDVDGEGRCWRYEVTRVTPEDDPNVHYPALRVQRDDERFNYVWLDGDTVGFVDDQTGQWSTDSPEVAEELAATLGWIARAMRERPTAWRVQGPGALEPPRSETDISEPTLVERAWRLTNDIYVQVYGEGNGSDQRSYMPTDSLEYHLPMPDGRIYRRQFWLLVVPDERHGMAYQPSVLAGAEGRERSYQLIPDGRVCYWASPNALPVFSDGQELADMVEHMEAFLRDLRQHPGDLHINGESRT